MLKLAVKILVLLTIVIGVGCGDEEEDQRILETTGYITGYDPCLTIESYEIGEGLLIATSTDTLLTYNFPENIVEFPDGFFDSWLGGIDNQDLEVRFRYKLANEDEIITYLCSWGTWPFGNPVSNFDQVVIISAEKIVN
ncbi:hypothetical protein ACFSKL_19105 [Belliella marina]|uniref:Uncharacterized protein n=1 Tax=Belliella marina TaxID=1644146 RepID=A0ABW4VRY6_9BACT